MLYQKYVIENKTIIQIARELNITSYIVSRNLKEHNIPIDKGKATRGNNNPMKREKVRLLFSNISKKLWESESYRKKVLSSLLRKPSSLELRFMELCKKYNLPFIYTGDGRFWIGRVNPDFIHVNGGRFCVELANHFWHSDNYEQERKEYLAQYGWKCLVVWEETDMNDEKKLVEKITNFLTNGDTNEK
jgi:hypothetical protein